MQRLILPATFTTCIYSSYWTGKSLHKCVSASLSVVVCVTYSLPETDRPAMMLHCFVSHSATTYAAHGT